MQVGRGAALALRRPGLVFLAIAGSAVVLDQISKALVRAAFAPGDSVPLITSVFHLTYVRNTGAAFGLLPGARPLFLATSLFVLFIMAAFWRRSRPNAWPVVVALACVTGGTVGNLIDRVLLGRVTDFFDFALIDFPVFNVADVAIVVGVGILTGWLLFGPEETWMGARDGSTDADARPETDPNRGPSGDTHGDLT